MSRYTLPADAPSAETLWFPEPDTPDNTYARRGEQPFDGYGRSRTARAVAARDFLNRNFGALPEDAQPNLIHGRRQRWEPTFFELIVARTLQLLGASLTVEPEGPEGKRVDFVAAFGSESVNVEATSPDVDAEFGEEVKHRGALVDIIEASIPDGWSAGIWELPAVGPNDSKGRFREAVTGLLTGLPIVADELVDIIAELAEGRLRLHMFPEGVSNVPIAFGPRGPYYDCTMDNIRRSVRGKKRQARSTERPSLLAVHAGGPSSEFEDFDLALFGHTRGFVDQHFGKVAK